jgi:hypothetical protein
MRSGYGTVSRHLKHLSFYVLSLVPLLLLNFLVTTAIDSLDPPCMNFGLGFIDFLDGCPRELNTLAERDLYEAVPSSYAIRLEPLGEEG